MGGFISAMSSSLKNNKSLRNARINATGRLEGNTDIRTANFKGMSKEEMAVFKTRLKSDRIRSIVYQIISTLVVSAIVCGTFYWLIFI